MPPRAIEAHGYDRTLAKRIVAVKDDPVEWVRRVLGQDPWSSQQVILRAIRDHRRVAVKSCHGAGKSTVAAWAVLWFLFCHRNSTVVTTAPTGRQVDEILWREIRAAYTASKYPLGGRMPPKASTIEVGPNWFALGYSTDKGDKFQGFHAPHILVVLDEASGVEPAIFDAMEGLTTGANVRVLLIGNPTNPSGHFARAFRPDSGYFTMSMPAFATPNFTGESERPYLVTPEWVEERRKDWGEDDPNWTARVLAEFPGQDEHQLIALHQVMAARTRDVDEDEASIIAADVARFGVDRTVIVHRKGLRTEFVSVTTKEPITETAARVIAAMLAVDAKYAVIDDDGVGGGVTDVLRAKGIRVFPFRNGSKSRTPKRFANRRAEGYWGLRERFQQGLIAIPDDEKLTGELTALRYGFTNVDQIKVESKDEMRKRGLRSPDLADAVMMAYAHHDPALIFEPDAPTDVLEADYTDILADAASALGR